jgi:hypothetical protein
VKKNGRNQRTESGSASVNESARTVERTMIGQNDGRQMIGLIVRLTANDDQARRRATRNRVTAMRSVIGIEILTVGWVSRMKDHLSYPRVHLLQTTTSGNRNDQRTTAPKTSVGLMVLRTVLLIDSLHKSEYLRGLRDKPPWTERPRDKPHSIARLNDSTPKIATVKGSLRNGIDSLLEIWNVIVTTKRRPRCQLLPSTPMKITVAAWNRFNESWVSSGRPCAAQMNMARIQTVKGLAGAVNENSVSASAKPVVAVPQHFRQRIATASNCLPMSHQGEALTEMTWHLL